MSTIPYCGATMASGLICQNTPKINCNGRCGIHKSHIRLFNDPKEIRIKELETQLHNTQLISQEINNNRNLILSISQEIKEFKSAFTEDSIGIKNSINTINSNIKTGVNLLNNINNKVNETHKINKRILDTQRRFIKIAENFDFEESRLQRHDKLILARKEKKSQVILAARQRFIPPPGYMFQTPEKKISQLIRYLDY